MNEVRALLETEYDEWDEFVEKSPQGTIFSTTRWMKLFDIPFKILAYYKGEEMAGGIAYFCPIPSAPNCYSGWTLTPFQGVLICPTRDMKYTSIISLHNEVTTALIQKLENTNNHIKISNHYTFPDIRPFIWAGFKQSVRYTYVVDLTDMDKLRNNLEKQTRYEITKADKEGVVYGNCSDAISFFDALYGQTFERKGMKRPISSKLLCRLCENFNADIYLGYKSADAGIVMIRDNKRAYYILGASRGEGTSSLALWTAFVDLASVGIKEVDLVGCNDYNIALFKRGFGGKLMPYYEVNRGI